jgi:DNA-binding NarL/FixJ family response regulator
MDGEQAFHAIQAIRSDIPILLTSGFSETEAVSRLSLYNLAGFIRKPYTRDTFIGEIRRHLPE